MMSALRTFASPSRWPDAWSGYWFTAFPVTRLAVMRILLVAAQLFYFGQPLRDHLKLLNSHEGFKDPQILVRLIAALVGEQTLRDPDLFTFLHRATMVAGVFALVGLLTRPAMLIFGFMHVFLISHIYSYADEHHNEALFVLTLFLFAFAPCGRALSIDSLIARRRGSAGDRPEWGLGAVRTDVLWVILVAQWLLCFAYLYAGLAKVIRGGPDWFNGTTLQTYLLMDAIRWDRPVGLWMAQHKTLCIIASYGAVGLELFVIVGMIFKRLMPLFLIGLAGMHIGIYIMQKAGFWQFLVLYLLWVPWERLPVLRASSPARLSA